MATEPPDEGKQQAGDTERDDVLITPDGETLDQSIVGTMNLDTRKHRRKRNPNRLSSLKFAVAGLLYVLVREQSIQLASIATIAVVLIGLWLEIPVFYWAFLTLALGMIWVAECLNTAIEAAINLTTSDPHPLAKIGKDVASAAALVSTIVFVIIVILILIPRLIDRVNMLAG